MSVESIINSQAGNSQFMFDQSGYNLNQQNVNGENLAPVTPQGTQPALDYKNDTTSDEQRKINQQQANRDAQVGYDQFTSAYGNKYRKVDDSLGSQMMLAIASYSANYLGNGGDAGAAVREAGKVSYAMGAKANRFKQINDLEKKGYAQADIQRFIESGDSKDLITNKGEWSALGDGVHMYNKLTGETRAIQGAADKAKQIGKTVDLGDRQRIYKNDGTFEDVEKGVAPKADDDENLLATPGVALDANGNLISTSVSGGKATQRPANKDETEAYNSKHQNATGGANSGADYDQFIDNMAYMSTRSNEDLGKYFNLSRMAPEKAQEVLTQADPTTRETYNRMYGINSSLQGVGARRFRQMYGSPVKTDQDALQAKQLQPRLDTTNVTGFGQTFTPAMESLIEANGYDRAKVMKDVAAAQARYQTPQQPQGQQSAPANQGGTIQVKRDANGKLIIGG